MSTFFTKFNIICSHICSLFIALVLSIACGSSYTFAKEPVDRATAIKYRKIIMRRKMIKHKIIAKEKAEKEAKEASEEKLKSDKKDNSAPPQDSTSDDEGFKSIQDESPSESQE
jgi:hypothetical protein